MLQQPIELGMNWASSRAAKYARSSSSTGSTRVSARNRPAEFAEIAARVRIAARERWCSSHPFLLARGDPTPARSLARRTGSPGLPSAPLGPQALSLFRGSFGVLERRSNGFKQRLQRP